MDFLNGLLNSVSQKDLSALLTALFNGGGNGSSGYGGNNSGGSGGGGTLADLIKGIDAEKLLSLLRLFAAPTENGKTETAQSGNESAFESARTDFPHADGVAPIADIADRDIVYTLNRFVLSELR